MNICICAATDRCLCHLLAATGFPTWEIAVFDMLRTHFEQLRSIFDYYAKSGTAGSSSAGALLTMQQSELQTLAIDVGMTTDKVQQQQQQQAGSSNQQHTFHRSTSV